MANVRLGRRLAVALALTLTVLAAVAGLTMLTRAGLEPASGLDSGSGPAVVLAVQAHAVVANFDPYAEPAVLGAGVLADDAAAVPAIAVDSSRTADVVAPTGRSPPLPA